MLRREKPDAFQKCSKFSKFRIEKTPTILWNCLDRFFQKGLFRNCSKLCFLLDCGLSKNEISFSSPSICHVLYEYKKVFVQKASLLISISSDYEKIRNYELREVRNIILVNGLQENSEFYFGGGKR